MFAEVLLVLYLFLSEYTDACTDGQLTEPSNVDGGVNYHCKCSNCKACTDWIFLCELNTCGPVNRENTSSNTNKISETNIGSAGSGDGKSNRVARESGGANEYSCSTDVPNCDDCQTLCDKFVGRFDFTCTQQDRKQNTDEFNITGTSSTFILSCETRYLSTITNQKMNSTWPLTTTVTPHTTVPMNRKCFKSFKPSITTNMPSTTSSLSLHSAVSSINMNRPPSLATDTLVGMSTTQETIRMIKTTPKARETLSTTTKAINNYISETISHVAKTTTTSKMQELNTSVNIATMTLFSSGTTKPATLKNSKLQGSPKSNPTSTTSMTEASKNQNNPSPESFPISMFSTSELTTVTTVLSLTSKSNVASSEKDLTQVSVPEVTNAGHLLGPLLGGICGLAVIGGIGYVLLSRYTFKKVSPLFREGTRIVHNHKETKTVTSDSAESKVSDEPSPVDHLPCSDLSFV